MRDILTSATVALLVAGAAAVAAPGQGTVRPGDPTRADVWVSNHGRTEAIPVDLRQSNLDQPLGIRVLNGDRATQIPPVRVASAQTTWEYRTAVVKPNDQLARTLTTIGAEGWETTGISWPGADGDTMLLFKRPR